MPHLCRCDLNAPRVCLDLHFVAPRSQLQATDLQARSEPQNERGLSEECGIFGGPWQPSSRHSLFALRVVPVADPLEQGSPERVSRVGIDRRPSPFLVSGTGEQCRDSWAFAASIEISVIHIWIVTPHEILAARQSDPRLVALAP